MKGRKFRLGSRMCQLGTEGYWVLGFQISARTEHTQATWFHMEKFNERRVEEQKGGGHGHRGTGEGGKSSEEQRAREGLKPNIQTGHSLDLQAR